MPTTASRWQTGHWRAPSLTSCRWSAGSAKDGSFLEVDHFKVINDTYGHRAGDLVLKESTRMVGSLTRDYDLLARCGGEEFMLASRNSAWPDTIAMIERLLEGVRTTVLTFDGHEIEFTCSCGIADSSEFLRDEFGVRASNPGRSCR